MVHADCTEACEARPECVVCRMYKHPRGRDPGMDNGSCGVDCPGYYQDPQAGHLWPGELARERAESAPSPNREDAGR